MNSPIILRTDEGVHVLEPADDITAKEAAMIAIMLAALRSPRFDLAEFIAANNLKRHFPLVEPNRPKLILPRSPLLPRNPLNEES